MSQTMKALQAMIREGITVKDACARFGISPAAISKGRLHPSVKMTMQFEIETSRARAAELEAALKAARDGIDEFLVAKNSTEFGCACDLSVGYLCGPCHADMQQEPLKIAIAKINEVLHD